MGVPQNTADGDCSHEIKKHLLLGRKVMTNVDSLLKNRDMTLPTKFCLVKATVFPVVMYGCGSWAIKKAEHRIIIAFELWFWRRLFRVSWTARRPNQSILKWSVLGAFHWKNWCWSWNSNTLATWCEELTPLKRPWSWQRLWAGRQGDKRGLDGWMASQTQWTWVWVNSRSWWWTERPGVLWFLRLQKVRHNLVTELTEYFSIFLTVCPIFICCALFWHILAYICLIWRMEWQPTPVFLSRESCRQRSLVGCCP